MIWYRCKNATFSYWYQKRTAFLMQLSMGTLNSRQILWCINFGIGESSPNLFLNMVNLYQVRIEARWTLNELAFYCFIIFFIWKGILT